MFDDHQLGVVISGPIIGTMQDKSLFTREACASARTMLPNAEIILSTWENEDVSGLDYDVLVCNKDPGANEGNVNRQICSRMGGVKKSSERVCFGYAF